MIEIIPNWHPIFVHFTVGLIATSAGLFLVTALLGKRESTSGLRVVAHWLLWLGAAMTALTFAAGLFAYNTVAHDDVSHAAMTNHRNWAFVTSGLILLSATLSFWRYRDKRAINSVLLSLVILTAGFVGITAYKGGELVYRYGLGVMSLPKVEAGDDGHDHEHADTPSLKEEHGHSEGDEIGDSHEVAAGVSDEHNHDHVVAVSDEPKAEPSAIADAFHRALSTGDEAAVGRLLADDVLILESGHAQKSREEYMSGHMKSDMAFLPNVKTEVIERKSSQSGNLAWVITHSKMVGTYNDQTIDMLSREMLVMRHDSETWKITLVHWGEK